MRNIREPFYPKKSAGGSSNHSYICVVCDIDGIDEEVIFTSCLNDVEEYGVQVFQNAKNGMYGTVTEGRIVN